MAADITTFPIATIKVTEMTTDSTPTNSDILMVVDNADGESKQMTIGALLSLVPAGGIVSLVSDPVSPTEGDVWYNSTSNVLKYFNGISVISLTASGTVPDASTTVKGIIELATQTEVNTGTDTVRAVTPATLKVVTDTLEASLVVPDSSTTVKGIIELATQSEVTTGTDTVRAVTPATLKVVTDTLQTNLTVPDASTTVKGKIEIATQAEVNTGTDTVRAVTPATLKVVTDTINNNISDIELDITTIQQDITNIQGDITDIQGDITDIQGDITNIVNDLNDIATVSIVPFTANEDIAIGDAVGVASNIANNVMKAVYSYREQTAAGTNTYDNSSGLGVCEIDTNKYVVLVTDQTPGFAPIKAVVVELDQHTMNWNIGTLSATFTNTGQTNTVSISRLDTNKFIVFDLNSNNPYSVQTRVGTVSGLTVTLGGFITITGGSGANMINSTQIDVNKVALLVSASSSVSGSHRVDLFEVSVTGVTPTAGTAVNVLSGIRNSNIAKVDTNKVAIITVGSPGTSQIRTATVSGGTWTVNSPVTLPFDLVSSNYTFGMLSRITNELAFVSALNANTSVVAVYNVTTTPTLISSGTVGVSSTDPAIVTDGTLLATIIDGDVYMVHENGSNLSMTKVADIGLSFSQKKICNSSSLYYFAIAETPSEPVDVDKKIKLRYHVQGMTNLFTGIAQNTATRGNIVNTKISGIDSNQTELALGARYSALKGNIVYDANGNMQAISGSSIIIK